MGARSGAEPEHPKTPEHDLARAMAGTLRALEGAEGLERRGVDVLPLQMTKACAAFYDDVFNADVRVRRHPALDRAIRGARKRNVGDAWAWARKDTTVDVSPLVAATGALWASTRLAKQEGGLFLAVT